MEPAKSADQSRNQNDHISSFDGLPGSNQQVFNLVPTDPSKTIPNSNEDEIGLDEIKVELVDSDSIIKVLPVPGALHYKSVSAGSGLDSYNDDDEIEDENRNPAAMQINHSNNVTRAGAQRGNFVNGKRQLSPNKRLSNWGNIENSSLPQILEIGTEETVIRINKDLKLSHSPSIRDLN